MVIRVGGLIGWQGELPYLFISSLKALMSLASHFCELYDSLDDDDSNEVAHYTRSRKHPKEEVKVNSLGYLQSQLLDFEDLAQEISVFLGRDGGLQEFLSIVHTGEVFFLTEEAKLAVALDLLYGQLSETILSQWPPWKLQELSNFLDHRIRALERSSKLNLSSSFSVKKENAVPVKKTVPKLRQQKQTFSTTPDSNPKIRETTWKVVSEFCLDSPSLIAKKEAFFYETGGDYSAVLPEASSFLFIQDEDLDISYYEEYFARRDHRNYLAFDEVKGHIAMSLVNSEEDQCVRILIRTFDEDVRMKTTESVKIPSLLKNIRLWFPSLTKTKFFHVKDLLPIENDLLKIERNHVTCNYKFGVLYCKEGQMEEDDMFSNEHGSDDFNEFLAFLGQEVALKGFDHFCGGLDNKNDTTGTHSIFTEVPGYDIMFHVSTLLPFMPNDPQKLERKRHLGNDVVVIVFKEGDQLFHPDCIHSMFNHVFIVIQKQGYHDDGTTLYRVEICCKDSLPQPWRPMLPEPPIYKKDENFREFLLTKCINAERASMHTSGFIHKSQRTRKMIFEDLFERYVPANQRKQLAK